MYLIIFFRIIFVDQNNKINYLQKQLKDVRCRGNVEDWLNILQKDVQNSLQNLIEKSYYQIVEDEEFKILRFFKESLTQVCLRCAISLIFPELKKILFDEFEQIHMSKLENI